MEGYTNVNVNLHDFDNLDIEGRMVVDDWNQEEDFSKGLKEDEQKRILEAKVRLDDGTFGEMCSVVKKQHGFSYTCHVCTVTCAEWDQFKLHLGSIKHMHYMRKPEHPRNKFVKLDPNEDMALEPGEPVPPGLEQVVIANCRIQPIIDAYTSGPLIGLEYLVELNSDFETDLEYICMLCEKVGKNRSILGHLTSQGHYKRYISNFFRSAVKLYNEDLPRNNFYRKRCSEVVTRIARKIESKYGRMKPKFENASSFANRKAEVLREIEEGHHFREAQDDRFDDCLLLTDPSPTTKGSVNAGESDWGMLTKTQKDELVEGSQAKVTTDANKGKNTPLSQINTNMEKNNLIGEKLEDTTDVKGDDLSKSLFIKGKINAEKRQLRPRDENKEDRKSSSPEIVGIEIIAPDAKKLKRSASISSISISTGSRSKSRSKSRTKSRGRSSTKSRIRSPYKSRARSPFRSRYRSRSRNRSYGRYSRRSRSSSAARRYRMRRHSRSRGRNRSRSSSRSRSPSHADRFGRTIRSMIKGRESDYNRSKKKSHHSDKHSDDDGLKNERRKWEKFREEFLEVETTLFERLKYFEKNPEKHPQYPEEWKVFWNKRYKEIQGEGKDPAKHDFKPEWIVFWTKRMKEIHEDDLKKRKEILKDKFGLPSDTEPKPHFIFKDSVHSNNLVLDDISPPTPDRKDAIADIKNTWKALTGSDIKESKRPLSPWEEESKLPEQSSSRSDHHRSLSYRNRDRERSPDKRACFVDNVGTVVSLLRKLAVLESSLGSLGPRVLDLLSVALTMDKVTDNGSQDLLAYNEHCVFLETVKEKLKGLLFAGVVARNMVNTTRSAIRSIDHLIAEAPKIKRESYIKPILIPVTPAPQVKPVDPVSVPGVGRVDKAAIAQQIAVALIQQGRTNVTEDELEQLINAVVGMAEASSNTAQPISAAAYVSKLQFDTVPALKTEPQVKPPASSGLTLLQSAYDDVAKPDVVDLTDKVDQTENKIPNINAVEDLSETDLKNLVQNFNDLSEEEKKGLKNYLNKLESSSPETITRLKPVIPPGILLTPAPAKRSPIVIPISKEKSEQKIKPTEQETGRLSPFSMRSGGINPTADTLELELNIPSSINPTEEIVENPVSTQPILVENDDDDDDNDDDDDDDDDDYSFEDVYKAASEKLRLKQIEEENAKGFKKNCNETTNPSELNEVLNSDVSKLSTPLTAESKTLNQIKSSSDNHDIIETKAPAKPQEYQVNLNNYAQFASNPNPVFKQYPEQSYSESYDYPDDLDGRQGNYPVNHNQGTNYPSVSDLQTRIPGIDSQSSYPSRSVQPSLLPICDLQGVIPGLDSQVGYPNRNLQINLSSSRNFPSIDSQTSYSNRNLQGSLAPSRDLQGMSSLNSPGGYSNHNFAPSRLSQSSIPLNIDSQSRFPNRNLQTKLPQSRDIHANIPNHDLQTSFTSNCDPEDSFLSNRNQLSNFLPDNYPPNRDTNFPSIRDTNFPSGRDTSFPHSRDTSANFSSNLSLPLNRSSNFPSRYSEFDSGSRYAAPRTGNKFPYAEQPSSFLNRESESEFYSNRSYPYEQTAPNSQPFNRYKNVPRY